MSKYLYSHDVSEEVRRKVRIFVILVGACFLVLWMRVWYLQILKGENFETLSENNRVRLVSLPSFRGKILDRNGTVLASIRPSYNLYITPEDAGNLNQTLRTLKRHLDFDIDRVLEDARTSRPFKPVLVRADIDRTVVAFIEENNRILPGVQIKVEPLRNYLHDHLASHLMGYLGEISEARLEAMKDADYMMGDMIGQYGLELFYESELTGKKGYKEIEVDVAGRQLRTLRKLPPQSGRNLVLTLDYEVQKVVDKLMTGTKENPIVGSAVVMDVTNGEVIAIVSKPDFNPNLFARGITLEEWRQMQSASHNPLQNRAVNGVYPPASTYKIVTAYAAMEEGIIQEDTKYKCPGFFSFGPRKGRFNCWKRSGHGQVNLYDALVQSCDVFFYHIGYELGVDRIAQYARQMGLGDFTQVRMNGERPGLVPTVKWKTTTQRGLWLPGDTIAASIGQGYNLVTPIQQARLISAIANGGKLFRPILIKQIKDKDNQVLTAPVPEQVAQLQPRTHVLDVIRKALLGVVYDKKGTGRRAGSRKIKVAGKTGTAQVVALSALTKYEEKEDIPFEFRDHSWFVGYAPYDNPKIGVAVILEHGGSGGKVAAPLVRKIIEAYNKVNTLDKPSTPDGLPPEMAGTSRESGRAVKDI
ncbi:Penicillin-binding protein 2 [Nitrospina gracilis 3/211]|uniref:Penicillin-binding protein 2 n=1 Tax=Nitrospina gracilis (strain 3/211) TaxID=1266370 RepID=M1Z2B8_NITG3|nr:penicillin-binding protein 2 [Nitrospina gracilis]MCF8722012.1 penicillin-binding protein 2 [Nitrospina sp. Nb-3]CCQ92137.1 Penicillin-binding protein 2 [Nitrospina gracilis 3/211]